MDEAVRRRWRVRRRDRQIQIADRSIDGIAQALDHGILQGTRELALQLHLRQISPLGRTIFGLLAQCAEDGLRAALPNRAILVAV